jgi:hypothetical protein
MRNILRLSAATLLFAQAAFAQAADKELAAYKLSTLGLSKWTQVMKDAQASQGSGTVTDLTVAAMVDMVNKDKALSDAVRKAAWTPKEYALFSLSLIQAMGYVKLKEAGMSDLPKDVSADNIKFVQQHMKEIEAAQGS